MNFRETIREYRRCITLFPHFSEQFIIKINKKYCNYNKNLNLFLQFLPVTVTKQQLFFKLKYVNVYLNKY